MNDDTPDIPDDQVFDFNPDEETGIGSIMEDLRKAREAYEQVWRERCGVPRRIILGSPPSGLIGEIDD